MTHVTSALEDQQRLLACHGKSGFATQSGAHVALKRMTRRRERLDKSRRLGVFRCQFCQKWHVGGSAK